jgi:nucleoside-triphosphatase THEP1
MSPSSGRTPTDTTEPTGVRGAILLLTGPSRAGKTTVCRAVIEQARTAGLDVAGILTEDDALPDGTRVQVARDLATGERCSLARARGPEHVTPSVATTRRRIRDRLPVGLGRGQDGESVTRWIFNDRGVALGRRALERTLAHGTGLLVVDQIGPRELIDGEGWMVAFDVLARGRFRAALVVVNPRVLDRAVERLPDCRIMDVNAHTRDLLPTRIVARYLRS